MPGYPGGLSELEFVEAYLESALRKPQVVADSTLRSLMLAGTGDRLALAGVLAEQLAEACRRLVAVFEALSDRRYPVARSLLNPLPGLAAWESFIQVAATFTPEQMLRELSIGEEGLDAARRLRGQLDLSGLSSLVAASETGGPMLLVPPPGLREEPLEFWLAGVSPGEEPVAARLSAEERDAAALADLTADLSSIARGFLGAYLGSRRSAGRRP